MSGTEADSSVTKTLGKLCAVSVTEQHHETGSQRHGHDTSCLTGATGI